MNLDDKEIKILDLILEYIPFYGEFNLSEKVNLIKKDKLEDIKKNLTNPDEQFRSIKDFLVEHGYAIKRNDVLPNETFIELKERGRWLKEQGSMRSYLDYQKQKKEKARHESEERLRAIERNKQMNKLTSWIAISTGMAAIYYLLEILNHILGFYCHY
jgi:hypothetical protein